MLLFFARPVNRTLLPASLAVLAFLAAVRVGPAAVLRRQSPSPPNNASWSPRSPFWRCGRSRIARWSSATTSTRGASSVGPCTARPSFPRHLSLLRRERRPRAGGSPVADARTAPLGILAATPSHHLGLPRIAEARRRCDPRRQPEADPSRWSSRSGTSTPPPPTSRPATSATASNAPPPPHRGSGRERGRLARIAARGVATDNLGAGRSHVSRRRAPLAAPSPSRPRARGARRAARAPSLRK